MVDAVNRCGRPETAAALPRSSSMNRRDMLLLAALLLISLIVTWLGTDYVLNHVVIPLIEDRQPGPDLPAS